MKQLQVIMVKRNTTITSTMDRPIHPYFPSNFIYGRVRLGMLFRLALNRVVDVSQRFSSKQLQRLRS